MNVQLAVTVNHLTIICPSVNYMILTGCTLELLKVNEKHIQDKHDSINSAYPLEFFSPT
jgi:hypothetical protein